MSVEQPQSLPATRAFSMWPTLPSFISPGAGKEAGQIFGQLQAIQNFRQPATAPGLTPVRFEPGGGVPAEAPRTFPTKPASIEEALFQNRARLKIMTSQVAMHLSEAVRGWLFSQLDWLLSPDSWHEDDILVRADSFFTFLRLLIFYRKVKFGSLGVSNAGHLLAAWLAEDHRLTMEFLPADQVRWAVSRGQGEARERAVGQCTVRRVSQVLMPYNAREWFIEDAGTDCP